MIPTAATPRLLARNVTKQYTEGDSARTVLAGIDLQVAPGETVVLMGRSGAGKSTLLNLLGGIEPPDSGDIFLDGEALTGATETARTKLRRRKLGFVFQFFNLIPTLTALENLVLPLELVGQRGPAAEERALQLLEAVGLADRARVFPDRLSGGEQQRVALARALVHKPALVLADEPTGNLDATTAGRVVELMNRLVKAEGQSMVIVTHNEDVVSLADRVLHLRSGHLETATHPDYVPS